jgi:hypothetical membrane protein
MTTITAPETTSSCTANVTKSLLGYGVMAGPLFVLVAGVQAVTRHGFDLRHHAASLLSNGPLGWIQITNFLLTGLMTVAAAVGVRRATRSKWASRLLAGYGAGLIGAGLFVADPMNGFPVGTPAGAPTEVSWHGMLHFTVGGLGFLSLIAACYVLARRFARQGRRGWAAYSAATGTVFFAAFVGIASGSGAPAVNVSFAVAVVAAWTWLAALSVHLFRRATA